MAKSVSLTTIVLLVFSLFILFWTLFCPIFSNSIGLHIGAGQTSIELFVVTFNIINFIQQRFRGWTLKCPAQRKALHVACKPMTNSIQTSNRKIIMNKLKYKIEFVLTLFLIYSSVLTAQVQVSKESHHKNVLENKYVRLLDVWINPGDTTLFHIHSTPSLFLYFTNTDIGTQIMGQEWIKNRNIMGKASYRSFTNDTLVHRVSNIDTSLFHVTDIELLSPYKPNIPIQPLPFTVLFDNEKAIAYNLTSSSLDKKIISNRRPMIAELVQGQEVIYYDALKKKSTSILTGKYLYIKPMSSFYFKAKENETINMILFEIK